MDIEKRSEEYAEETNLDPDTYPGDVSTAFVCGAQEMRAHLKSKRIAKVRNTLEDKTRYRHILNQYFAELLRINNKVHSGGTTHRMMEQRIKDLRTRMSRDLDNTDQLPPS